MVRKGTNKTRRFANLAAALSGDYGTEARAIILTMAYTGMRLTKGTLAYFWRSVRAGRVARGGRPIDLYELRHACATMLVERGLNVGDVAFQLGHQDGGRLVMTLYGHPGEDAIRDRLKMAHSQVSTVALRNRGGRTVHQP